MNNWFWGAVDSFIGKGLSFLAIIYFARIIGPTEFGKVGLISVIIALGNTLINSGFTLSLIRTKEVDRRHYSTIFFVNILLGISLTLIFFLLSSIISDFFRNNELELLIRVYSISFLLSALSSIHFAYLYRGFNFRKIAIINGISVILAIILSLFFLKRDTNALTVVYFYLANQLFVNICIWLGNNWRPSISHFSFLVLKEHLSFSFFNLITHLLNIGFSYANNILIGRFYSISSVSFYERGFSLSQYPVSLIHSIVDKVTLPTLSKIQDDLDKMLAFYKRSILFSFSIAGFIMLSIFICSDELILVLLGEEWIVSSQYLRIFSLAGIIYPLHALNLNFLNSIGRSNLIFKLEIFKKSIYLIIIIIGFNFGVIGLVYSYLIFSVIAFFVNSYYSGEFLKYSTLNQIVDLLSPISILLFSIVIFFVIESSIPDVTLVLMFFLKLGVFSLLNIPLFIFLYKKLY